MSLNPMTIKKDFYKILGVKPTDTADSIKKAYHCLAKKYHPDLNRDRCATQDRMKEITSAYEVLGNSSLRKEYDHLSIFQWRVPPQIKSGMAYFEPFSKKKVPPKKENAFLRKLRVMFLGPDKPGARDSQSCIMYLSMGLTIAQSYDSSVSEEVEKHFELAVTNDPENVFALYDYGLALYKNGKFREAQAQFAKIAQLSPRDGDSTRLLALLSDNT